MDAFLAFLRQQGAEFDERGVVGFPTSNSDTSPNASTNASTNTSTSSSTNKATVSVLTHLSCLWIKGPDAKKFLQGQVTCDVNNIQPYTIETANTGVGRWQRGAHCNSKGRMLFDFLSLSQLDDDHRESVGLLIEQDLDKAARSSLNKYMVFSKAELSDENNLVAIGLFDIDGEERLQQLLQTEIPAETHDVTSFTSGHVLRLSQNRYLCLLQATYLQSIWPRLQQHYNLSSRNQWELADIRDGLGHVRAETTEEFIPQDLNFQCVEAINFKKGCYIGQEVVARMEYRGKLKRHMRRACKEFSGSDQPLPTPGTKLFTIGSEQSVGTVVMAATAESGTFELLALVIDSSVETDNVFLDRETKQKLRFLPLPYAITN